MNSKEYKLPNGKTAVFEYDVCGIGKITLECMDMLMGQLIAYKRCIQSRSFWDAKHCDGCIFYDDCPFNPREDEDEPQTQLTAKCLNCNNSKVCKEKHWDGCAYEPKDEKTCETCRHWKYIAHEWQCEACKCQGYEPKDEPTISKMEQVDKDINVRSKERSSE